jgi:hypothetical protein
VIVLTDGEAWRVAPADRPGLRVELGLDGPEAPGWRAQVSGGGAGAAVLVLEAPMPACEADHAALVAGWFLGAEPDCEAPLRALLGLGEGELGAELRGALVGPSLRAVPEGCEARPDGSVWAPEGYLGQLELDDTGPDPAVPATLAGLDRPWF